MKAERVKWLAGLLLGVLALQAAASVRARSVVSEVDILELNAEMAEFLVRHVSPKQSPESRVSALMNAVFGKKGLDITYDSTATLTAVETFEAGHGNCLSFTVLFVALARHLGLDAYFEEIGEVVSWDRRGEIVVRNQHMVVEIEVENGRRRVDFLPEASKRYRSIRRISDRRALAHYYNNLGVDALTAGDVRAALAHFEAALSADETFTQAWSNIGAAHRRNGDFDAAERSHLRALEIAPNESAALTNLTSLYLAYGLQAKAEPLLRRVDSALARNPFHHYRQGLASVRAGSWQEAARNFREAIRRMPEESEFHAALGDALRRSGELAKAREAFERALALCADEQERQRLQGELASFGGVGGPSSRPHR